MIAKEREERVVTTQSACMVRIDTYHRSHSKKKSYVSEINVSEIRRYYPTDAGSTYWSEN